MDKNYFHQFRVWFQWISHKYKWMKRAHSFLKASGGKRGWDGGEANKRCYITTIKLGGVSPVFSRLITMSNTPWCKICEIVSYFTFLFLISIAFGRASSIPLFVDRMSLHLQQRAFWNMFISFQPLRIFLFRSLPLESWLFQHALLTLVSQFCSYPRAPP